MKLKILLIAGFLAFIGSSAEAQCTADAQYFQSGATVTFYDSSTAQFNHVSSWDFGDSTYATGAIVSHTYTANGTYTVTLVVNDAIANCSDTAYFTVIVSSVSTCNASFTSLVDSINPYKINFNNTSSNAVSSYWWFGGSNSSSQTSPSFTFATAGYKTVCLTTYDTAGNLCDSICNTVYVPGTTSSCAADGWFYITDSTVHFFDSSYAANGYFIEWSFGDGGTSNASNPSNTYATNQYYTACLYIEDSITGCNDTTCWSIFISGSSSSTCNAAFTYTVDSLNPYRINFNNTSTNAVTAYWWFGGSNSSTSYNPSHTFSAAGYQTVCLTTYDSSGNLCDSICQSVYVPGQTSNTSCDASFYAFTQQGTTYFYNSTNQNNIIEYSFGDGSYGYSSSPSHTYTNSGVYNACLFVYDVDSVGDTLLCDSFCQTITIASPSNCTTSFTAHPDSINMSASSFPVDFSNNSTGVNYLWNFGDGSTDTTTNPTHIYTTAGTYTACLYVLTGYDSLGLPVICDSICNTVTVGGNPVSCQASYYLGVDTNNLYNLYIINNSTGITSSTSYYWTFGDGSSSTAQYPTHQYTTFGLYNLCLTISDSASGCSSTHCDSIGLDSNGNLLKKDGFGITVVDEKDLLNTSKIDAIQGVNVYPNPTAGRFTIELNAQQAEDLEIMVMSSLGQVVSTITERVYAGENTLEMDLSNQNTGIYFVTLRAGNQVKNVKLNIISE